jgi:transposase-like protein
MTEKKKTGRPQTYNPQFHPAEYLRLALEGQTVRQIAATWGLAMSTLFDWKKRHTEFRDKYFEAKVKCYENKVHKTTGVIQ